MVNTNVQKRGIIGGTIAVLCVTTLLASCDTNRPQANNPADTANVATQEVANNPDRYLGQTVTIRSEPIKKFGPNSFTVSDEQFFGSEPILVLNASGKPFVLPADNGQEVQVTGEVRKFVVADIEREYSLGLQPDAYRDYENKPAILAQSIALSPKPGEITQNPNQYYGKTLAVTGEVTDYQSPNVFKLDEDKLFGGTDLLVIQATPKGANQPATNGVANQPVVNDGEKVAVTGVLRPFVIADLERDYDLTWNLDVQRKLEAEYRQKPVLVATGVYPSAIPTYQQ